MRFLLPVALLLSGVPVSAQAARASGDEVLVLDNSGSMKKNDPEFLAGVAVREFLDRLSSDFRVAIVLFDQEARLLMPLTTLDESTRAEFLLALGQVTYRGLLTDSPAAIERALYELKTNARPGTDRSIVFFTDGIVDTGNPAMDAEKSAWLRNDLAAEAAKAGIRIFGIAFTDNADFFLIQSLSRRTGGEYFRAYSPAEIGGVFQRIIGAFGTEAPAAPPPSLALPDPGAPGAGPLPSPESAAQRPDAATGPGGLPAGPFLPRPETAAPEPPLLPEAAPVPDAGLPTLSEINAAGTPPAGPPGTPAAPGEAAAESPEPRTDAEPAARAWPPPALIAAGAAGLILLAGALAFTLRRRSGPEPEAARIPKAFLNDLEGVTAKPSYELSRAATVIGRIGGGDADDVNYVVIAEATIGRRHAMVEYRAHAYWIVDQGSLNGTFVNNRRIDNETRLKHGDRVRFHRHEFEFLLLDMLETDRTMMGRTLIADASGVPDAGAVTGPLGPAGRGTAGTC